MAKVLDAIRDAMRKHPKGKPLNDRGAEVTNPIPMEPPLGYVAQPSMFELVRDMVAAERKRIQALEEIENPQEADDFDIGDDYDPSSPYEHDFDHVGDPVELARMRDALDGRIRELGAEASSSARPADSGAAPAASSAGGSPASTSGPGAAGGPAAAKVT